MAIFRKIHTTLWSDPFISDLNHKQKLFYIYLITNDRTTQCGIYEISLKKICFDLDLSKDEVKTLIKFFTDAKKIKYNEQTKEIALGNWAKYNNSTSPKVQSCINKELKEVKDRVLIQYLYSIDTASQEEQEEEQEEEQNKNKENLYRNSEWRNQLLKFHKIDLAEYERHLERFINTNSLERDWKEVQTHWKRFLNLQDKKSITPQSINPSYPVN